MQEKRILIGLFLYTPSWWSTRLDGSPRPSEAVASRFSASRAWRGTPLEVFAPGGILPQATAASSDEE